MKRELENPFKVGDRVIFTPDDRTIGWIYSSFDRIKLHPGELGFVTRIENEKYLFLDMERGGVHWQCFRKFVE